MTDTPWLSVLMPLHEGERHLPATLDSMAGECSEGVEIIALDSSPHRRCEEIVRRYAGRVPIRYSHTPDCKPWTAKTNRAAQQARAANLCMLHQDDLWLAGRLADIREAIALHPGAALLLNPSHIVDRHGRKLGLWRCPLPAGHELAGDRVAEHLLVQNFVAIPAPVIRRDAWMAAGGLDERLWYTADWDLYLKLARCGPTVYRKSATTGFRVHGASQTMVGSTDREDFLEQMTAVIERHIDLAPAAARAAVRKRAAASSRINWALALAAAGRNGALSGALNSVLRLGPVDALRYFRDSRIVERAVPRLRARLAGAL